MTAELKLLLLPSPLNWPKLHTSHSSGPRTLKENPYRTRTKTLHCWCGLIWPQLAIVHYRYLSDQIITKATGTTILYTIKEIVSFQIVFLDKEFINKTLEISRQQYPYVEPEVFDCLVIVVACSENEAIMTTSQLFIYKAKKTQLHSCRNIFVFGMIFFPQRLYHKSKITCSVGFINWWIDLVF